MSRSRSFLAAANTEHNIATASMSIPHIDYYGSGNYATGAINIQVASLLDANGNPFMVWNGDNQVPAYRTETWQLWSLDTYGQNGTPILIDAGNFMPADASNPALLISDHAIGIPMGGQYAVTTQVDWTGLSNENGGWGNPWAGQYDYPYYLATLNYQFDHGDAVLGAMTLTDASDDMNSVGTMSGWEPPTLNLTADNAGQAKFQLNVAGLGDSVVNRLWEVRNQADQIVAQGGFPFDENVGIFQHLQFLATGIPGGGNSSDPWITLMATNAGTSTYTLYVGHDDNGNAVLDVGDERSLAAEVQVYRPDPVADLDIDSDNNDGLSLPGRTYAEDAIEDVTNNASYPGKIIWADTGDADGDGVPDYADGFAGHGGQSTANAAGSFVPVVFQVGSFSAGEQYVRFTYDEAALSDISSTTDSNGVVHWTPGTHGLRLWTLDGTAARTSSNLITNGQTYALSTFANQRQEDGSYLFYVEGINASSGVADQPIALSLRDAGGTELASDQVRVTTIDLAPVDIVADEIDTVIEGPDSLLPQAFRIFRREAGGTDETLVGDLNGDDRYAEDTDLQPATTYIYTLQIETSATFWDLGEIPITSAPLAPVTIRATDITTGGVTVTWTDDPDSTVVPDGYLIFRSDESDPSAFALIGSTAASVHSFADSSVTAGAELFYELEAIYKGQDSGVAEVMRVRIPPAQPPVAPTAALATVDPSGAIDVSWSDDAIGETRLRLERSKNGSSYMTIAFLAPFQTTYHDDAVDPSESYVYRISPQNGAGTTTGPVTISVTSPSTATGEVFTDPDPAQDAIDGVWVSDIGPDGRARSGGEVFGYTGGTNSTDLSEAQQLVDDWHLGAQIQVAFSISKPGYGYFHVYQKVGLFNSGDFIGSYMFKAGDTNDTNRKFLMAQNSAANGRINSIAADTAEITQTVAEVAAVFIPGPDDVIIGALITKAVEKLLPVGIKAVYAAGKWIFKRGEKVLAGEAAAEAEKLLRQELIKQLGEDIKWTNYGGKHSVKGNIPWSDIIKSTKGKNAVAKYLPSVDQEFIERAAWKYGDDVTIPGKGVQYKVFEFPEVVGASEGKEVRWVRVEKTTTGEMHGHPISFEEYRDRLRNIP